MKTVYIETSIISYLTARPSRDLVAAARQQITHVWWEEHPNRFTTFVSPLVKQESAQGDADAAKRRLQSIEGLQVLEVMQEAYELAGALISEAALPSKAQDDAAHIALATVHNIDYLLTWNCRHIDNAETKPVMRAVCSRFGYTCPEICTPEELMGGIGYE